MRRAVVILAGLLALTGGASGSGATFVARSADDTARFNAALDWTAPAVALTDPGTPLAGTTTLAAAASDAVSGVASVRVQRAPAGGTTWTDVCVDETAPFSCAWATTGVADGLYDLRAIAIDGDGNRRTSAVVGSRRVDNTAPAVVLADPGAMRASVTLRATATDASALGSFRIQGRVAGATTWGDLCTGTASPVSCAFDTTRMADGPYELRGVATDAAGNTTNTPVLTRPVDNTAPRPLDVQTTNVAGGIEGRPETGDVLVFTFSEALAPASVLAGWAGADTPVSVRVVNGTPDVLAVGNAAGTARLPLGSIDTSRKFVNADLTFNASTMTMTGSTVRIVLGTPATPPVFAGSTPPAGTLTWTPLAGMTDVAGNPLTPVAVAETGALDRDL